MPQREVGDPRTIAEKEWRRRHDQHPAVIGRCLAKRPLVIIGRLTKLDSEKPQAKRGSGVLSRLPLVTIGSVRVAAIADFRAMSVCPLCAICYLMHRSTQMMIDL
jgi:hypothetical protein